MFSSQLRSPLPLCAPPSVLRLIAFSARRHGSCYSDLRSGEPPPLWQQQQLLAGMTRGYFCAFGCVPCSLEAADSGWGAALCLGTPGGRGSPGGSWGLLPLAACPESRGKPRSCSGLGSREPWAAAEEMLGVAARRWLLGGSPAGGSRPEGQRRRGAAVCSLCLRAFFFSSEPRSRRIA